MSKKVKQFIGLLFFTVPLALLASAATLTPGEEHAKSSALIAELMKNYHYSRPELNNELSSTIFDRYIESLDPNKHFFLKGDIQSFEPYRYHFDDAFVKADNTGAFAIYNIFRERVRQRTEYALTLLQQPMDFSRDENYRVDYESEPWAETVGQLNELWRKRVKNDYLTLKLTDKEHDKIISTLEKRYQRVIRRGDQQTANDVYQLFANAYTTAVDPHSTYFSPHSSENFNINMRLSLEGIGAALRSKNEYTQVQRVIKGGPADRSGEIKAKDKINGVAQGEEEMVDVIGWRLQDVVELIRGPKDSTVRLLLQPHSAGPDGMSKEVTLVRDKIKLEEQAAKSSVIERNVDQQQIKIGVIDLPTFYLDFEARSRGDKNYRSTTRDVTKLIDDLKAQQVDGIVVDLRGNGGGSLSEATELTGLFIASGPVVQVKNVRGKMEMHRDLDEGIAYSGPLAVLVDRYSASASEIFAGAIQDYGRGIVIGEPTFGKGTVQTLIDLNRFEKVKKLGQLKITIAQFFRINGDSTQHRGVLPDIIYPTVIDNADQGERSLDNALPWAKVAPVNHKLVSNDFSFTELNRKHQARIADDAGFAYLIDAAHSAKKLQQQETVSLSEESRRKKRSERREKALALENKFRQSRGLESLTLEDKNKDDDDDIDEEKEDEPPALKIQLHEAANILSDYIAQQRQRQEELSVSHGS